MVMVMVMVIHLHTSCSPLICSTRHTAEPQQPLFLEVNLLRPQHSFVPLYLLVSLVGRTEYVLTVSGYLPYARTYPVQED
jgi:hypothetical protein